MRDKRIAYLEGAGQVSTVLRLLSVDEKLMCDDRELP
jgi:hypothetical protein